MRHYFNLYWYWFVRTILFFLPDHPLIMRFRGYLYSFAMLGRGRNFQVAHNVIIVSAEGLTVGDDVYIAYGCVLIADKDVYIGNEVMFGPLCLLACGNHKISNGSYRWSEDEYAPINIGNGSWIGGASVLLPGASLPPRSVLAANSTLTRDYSNEQPGVYAGSPARRIKDNFV